VTDQPGQTPPPSGEREGSGTATEPSPPATADNPGPASPPRQRDSSGSDPARPDEPGGPAGPADPAGPSGPGGPPWQAGWPERSGGPDGPGGRGEPGGQGEPGKPAEPGPLDLAGRNALWLAIAGLALTLLVSLWGAVAGLVLCTAGMVMGFRTRRQAKRERVVSTGADVGIAVGGVGLVFALFVTGMSAVLYQEVSGYNRCLDASNTHSDREVCRDDFLRGVEDRFGTPRGQLERSPLFGITGGSPE
jgi:hypothetical protein